MSDTRSIKPITTPELARRRQLVIEIDDGGDGIAVTMSTQDAMSLARDLAKLAAQIDAGSFWSAALRGDEFIPPLEACPADPEVLRHWGTGDAQQKGPSA